MTLPLLLPRHDDVLRRPIPERLMRPDRIVRVFPVPEGMIEGGDTQVPVVELVELLGMRPLGPLDRAVELRRAGRQHEQGQAPGF